jgi:CheY-like chemotaxis protein
LKKIHTAGNTLMGLINDVLDISKVEAGRMELTPVQYDTAGMLSDLIALNKIRIGNKPITFTLEIDENFPSRLFGDDLRVKQILSNLLSNAFKYTKEGNVTLGVKYNLEGASESVHLSDIFTPQGGIAASTLSTPHSSVFVTFTISDTGIGIHKEDIDKLFTDYNQVDAKASRENDGPGLGLSITKKLVELMDGEISAESEFGKGSVFRARIRQGFVTDTPIGRETAESLRVFRYSEKKKEAQAKLTRPDLSYVRVLVADDFPVNLEIAVGMLRKYRMQVDCVTNGHDAVNCIAIGLPVYNAIFMDHMMPGMDGMAATAFIRALGTEYAKSIPIIALTANDAGGSEQMFLDNGFNAFLAKPYNALSLDAVIQKWIIQKRSHE